VSRQLGKVLIRVCSGWVAKGSTKVLLRERVDSIELPAVTNNGQCELLDRLRRDAVEAVLDAKKIRWSKDVSLHEDSELCRDQRRKIDAFIQHLLAGHDGKPCPSGDRPIVGARVVADLNLRGLKFPETPDSSQKN